MRNWCARHPLYFMGLYALFYLTFFALLERTIQTPDLWVHCRLDDLIPFCKYAIIPYSLWFPWIPFTLFFILYKGERSDFWRLCLPLFAGMTMALLFYADERLPVDSCVQLGHADAGLLPHPLLRCPALALDAPRSRRAVCVHHTFHHVVETAQRH